MTADRDFNPGRDRSASRTRSEGEKEDGIPLCPTFARDGASWDLFREVARDLEEAASDPDLVTFAGVRAVRDPAIRLARARLRPDPQPVCVAISILADLIAQGWQVRVRDGGVWLRRPSCEADRQAEKARIRRGLLIARDEQLAAPAVRAFVRSMAARRPGPIGRCSIFSLVRDGPELAAALREAVGGAPSLARGESLRHAIDPYVQFVTEDARCEWTGLLLGDVWRYFRYTWLMPARSTPGRNMMVLVRDAAVEPHPVLGIAQLSSSIVQQSERDRWIGWDRRVVLDEIEREASDEQAAWLLRSLEGLLEGLLVEDFLQERVMTEEERRDPDDAVIARLTRLGLDERLKHQREIRKTALKQRQAADDWPAIARSHLYRSKRALTLAKLLTVRQRFLQAGLTSASGDQLRAAVACRSFQQAVGTLVRSVKAARVGIHMMDVSIAGCVAPYNALLGGKLVSLLMASPEVREAYARRYGETASVIASGMKGEALVRKPDLVLLATNGLFGGGSSQYNRLRIPAERAGGDHGEIRFIALAETKSYGTFHFSQATIEEMKRAYKQRVEGTEVHGIFGEGVNPRLRKIRQELSILGFPQDALLRTGSPRSVYVVPLAHNFRAVLLGRSDAPDWVLPAGDPRDGSARIAAYWRERWLSARIHRPGVLDSVERHRRTYPMLHGAAVVLPSSEEEIPFDDMFEAWEEASDDD